MTHFHLTRGNFFLAGIAFLGVVAIAAALLIPQFIRPKNHGQLTVCKSNLKNLGTALEMYATDNGGRYPTSTADLVPNYLKTFPQCIKAGRDTYSATYTRQKISDEPSAYCLTHGSAGPCANYGRRLLREASSFREREKRWPTTVEEMKLDSKLLNCPYSQRALKYAEAQETYFICCGGLNHKDVAVPVDRPAYNGIDGLIER